MAQQFPTIKGLQPTTLQVVRGFEVHREPFVQILNVSRNHWFVVSTVNCEPGHVRVYNTIYTDVLDCIILIIASLLNCTMPSIIINMVDVGKQRNGSDCGVLALAMAFDLCAGHDPSGVIFDHKKIRQHLKNSESCTMSRFPIISTTQQLRHACTFVVLKF